MLLIWLLASLQCNNLCIFIVWLVLFFLGLLVFTEKCSYIAGFASDLPKHNWNAEQVGASCSCMLLLLSIIGIINSWYNKWGKFISGKLNVWNHFKDFFCIQILICGNPCVRKLFGPFKLRNGFEFSFSYSHKKKEGGGR